MEPLTFGWAIATAFGCFRPFCGRSVKSQPTKGAK
jgi:hypothetical protein